MNIQACSAAVQQLKNKARYRIHECLLSSIEEKLSKFEVATNEYRSATDENRAACANRLMQCTECLKQSAKELKQEAVQLFTHIRDSKSPLKRVMHEIILRCVEADPINTQDLNTLEDIEEHYKVAVSSGEQFDVRFLLDCARKRNYKGSWGESAESERRWLSNPYRSDVRLSEFDAKHVLRFAKQLGLDISGIIDEEPVEYQREAQRNPFDFINDYFYPMDASGEYPFEPNEMYAQIFRNVFGPTMTGLFNSFAENMSSSSSTSSTSRSSTSANLFGSNHSGGGAAGAQSPVQQASERAAQGFANYLSAVQSVVENAQAGNSDPVAMAAAQRRMENATSNMVGNILAAAGQPNGSGATSADTQSPYNNDDVPPDCCVM